jgi:hypothetical protein
MNFLSVSLLIYTKKMKTASMIAVMDSSSFQIHLRLEDRLNRLTSETSKNEDNGR